MRVSQIRRHTVLCLTLVTVCPYIAIHATDTFFVWYQVRLNAASCDEGDAAPMRVNHNHLTRSEAVVATLFLLETFAENSSTPYSVGNTPPPAGLFIGEGPGTKGNAQRRTLAVESVLRAASVPCGTMEDPSAYVVGVTSSGLRAW